MKKSCRMAETEIKSVRKWQQNLKLKLCNQLRKATATICENSAMKVSFLASNCVYLGAMHLKNVPSFCPEFRTTTSLRKCDYRMMRMSRKTNCRKWMTPHEIPVLVARGLLKPLGHPAPNAPKHFLTAILDDLRRDEKWHGKASDALQEYWRHKNARKQEPADKRQPSRLQTQNVDSED